MSGLLLKTVSSAVRESSPRNIKPVMTREERAIEAVYLRTRWQLPQNGTDKNFVKLRGNNIYVNKSLFGTESYVMTPITTNDH